MLRFIVFFLVLQGDSIKYFLDDIDRISKKVSETLLCSYIFFSLLYVQK